MKKFLFSILLVFLLVGFVKAAQPGLLVNEIAWMGTEESWADEWIELYNTSDQEISLEEWKLVTEDKNLNIDLQGTIEPNSFFILERTDDETLPEIKADQIYTGSLTNEGQYLKLMKGEKVIQEINDKAGWRAGNSDYKTMERGEEWHTSREQGGTPKEENSELVPKEEQMPAKPLTSSLSHNHNNFWFTLVVALVMSSFSVVVIYFLERGLKKVESAEIMG